ncbi:PID-CTERM protein-sorting domain-containing protein [Mesonia sp. K7]|uniref:PID-CTERM protein-sorting domain-containing protein n=1 Tax=Mesonia sp. K7 TaxID=2218606 RepID=UPI000DAAB343|nr:hypothetical protein [Mesonia sp. K7]PZD77013.1 hypothetical protein DNG35_10250 [Mesonia sp. K7]
MKITRYILALIITVCLGSFVTAQDFSDIPGFPDDVDDSTPSGAPIDGLIALGIAAGAIYGYRKIKKEDS